MKKKIWKLILTSVIIMAVGVLIYWGINREELALKSVDAPCKLAWEMTQAEFATSMEKNGYVKWTGENGKQGYLIPEFQGIEGAECVLVPSFSATGELAGASYLFLPEFEGIQPTTEAMFEVIKLFNKTYKSGNEELLKGLIPTGYGVAGCYIHDNTYISIFRKEEGQIISYVYMKSLKQFKELQAKEEKEKKKEDIIHSLFTIVVYLGVLYLVFVIDKYTGILDYFEPWVDYSFWDSDGSCDCGWDCDCDGDCGGDCDCD